MRWSRSIFELLSLGLVVVTAGCAGTATKRQAVEPFGAYRGPANPTRDGWSEPTVVSATEGQRLSRYFPGLSGRNRVSTASNANLAGVQAPQTANPSPRRVSMPAEVPARSESARVTPSSSPRLPASDLPPPFLPTAMTVPSARVPRPDLVADVEPPQDHQIKSSESEVAKPLATPPLPEVNPVTELISQGDLPPMVPGSPALTDIETKPTNLEQPAKPTSPPLPEVNPATSLAARTVVPPTEPIVPPPLRAQPRPELDVEDLAPRIAAANRTDESDLTADADPTDAPPLPPVDPLDPALNSAQPIAPTPAYAPQPAMFAPQPAQASTTIVRPRWVPFRRESGVFNKPIVATPYRAPRPWEFWNQAPTNAPAQAFPKPVPSQPKGWFGTSFQPRIRLWSNGTDK